VNAASLKGSVSDTPALFLKILAEAIALRVPVRSALPVPARSALPVPVRSALPVPVRGALRATLSACTWHAPALHACRQGG
jgi:hypothetical protein